MVKRGTQNVKNCTALAFSGLRFYITANETTMEVLVKAH